MSRPRLLDLFCGAGGCSVGYHRAGFDVVGVDNQPMPRYPYQFIQADALEYVAQHGHEFDAIHASPPCQGYSRMRHVTGKEYPLMIEDVRAALRATGKPYIIENVPGAPLIAPVVLVGSMFGLRTMRPRLFECSFEMPFVFAPPPAGRTAKMGRRPLAGEYVHVVGHVADVAYCKVAMGIDWMNREELTQAIPPAYTQYIGERLMEVLA